MFENGTKYDVINLEGQRLAGELVTEGLKFTLLMSLDQFDNDSFVKQLIIVKELSHLAYENAKDLYGIDGETIYEYLRGNVLNVKEFEKSYDDNMTDNARCLLMHMIVEEEGIDLKKIRDYMGLSLMENDTSELFAIMDKSVTELDPDNFRLMTIMAKPDFSISKLTSKDIERLNHYHEEYMKRNIYPRVYNEISEEEAVLNLAKSLGAKKKGLQ